MDSTGAVATHVDARSVNPANLITLAGSFANIYLDFDVNTKGRLHFTAGSGMLQSLYHLACNSGSETISSFAFWETM